MTKEQVVAAEVESTILYIRGQKVILDRDLAALYGVETKALKQAVSRNRKRFPADFMFLLTRKEFMTLRSQFVTSKGEQRGGTTYLPMAFTEQGVAMLSSVLRSERAIDVSIAVMRAFVKLRRMLATQEKLAQKLTELEGKYDGQFAVVFKVLNKLIEPSDKPNRRIGF